MKRFLKVPVFIFYDVVIYGLLILGLIFLWPFWGPRKRAEWSDIFHEWKTKYAGKGWLR